MKERLCYKEFKIIYNLQLKVLKGDRWKYRLSFIRRRLWVYPRSLLWLNSYGGTNIGAGSWNRSGSIPFRTWRWWRNCRPSTSRKWPSHSGRYRPFYPRWGLTTPSSGCTCGGCGRWNGPVRLTLRSIRMPGIRSCLSRSGVMYATWLQEINYIIYILLNISVCQQIDHA